MIKLILLAIIALSVLGLIVYFIFTPDGPQKTPALPQNNQEPSSSTIPALNDTKVSDLKIKPPLPLESNLYAPGQTNPSGTVKISAVMNKTMIEVESNSLADKAGFIAEGTCAQNGKITYPLLSLKNGKSQTAWEINLDEFKTKLPLSVKIFDNLKNIRTYTRCADIRN